MKYLKRKLKNGLTIIEVPSSDAESVVVDFFVKTGSRSEKPREHGISHFLEHFLFKGSKKYPSAMAISSLIDSIGGEMNANTGKEHTQFYIKASHQHLPIIFEVLTDMIQNPLLDEEELEREKGVIVEEINMYKDTPMAEIGNILERAMWPKDTLGSEIAGLKKTVTKFNRQMFVNYINNHYQTPNMILGISGKYNRKILSGLINRYWVKYPKKRFLGWQRVKDVQKSPRLKFEFKETEQAHLALGFKGLPYSDKRKYVQTILAAILGGGMSSRLFSEIRERRGLAYYISASGSSYQDTGNFTVSAGVKVEKITEAVKLILSELKKICTENVNFKELKKAKEYLKGRITLALEDNQSRLGWFLEDVAFYPKIETPKESFTKLDNVSAAEVQRLAQYLFQNKKMTLAVIGPYRNKKLFGKLINID